jgi:hypothetical protein
VLRRLWAPLSSAELCSRRQSREPQSLLKITRCEFRWFAPRLTTGHVWPQQLGPRDNDLMNTPPELSKLPVNDQARWLRGRSLVIAVAIVGVAVFTIALIAALLLGNARPNSDWIPIYQDVLKTSFGALAVGGLGGLAKLVFDQHKAQEAAANEKRKEREAAADELRDRRYRFISTLVEVIYNIETAKLVIRANRSVRSWTDMVNDRILPGCSRLADMTHQLNNWAEAGSPMFDDTEGVAKELQGMNDYFAALLAEYGNKKQALGELQLKAEEAKQTSHQARKQLLAQIWNEMQELQFLGGSAQQGPRRYVQGLPQQL